jgi:hypothetical protein
MIPARGGGTAPLETVASNFRIKRLIRRGLPIA